MFTAVVRVSGAGRLADFRERLRSIMVYDEDAEDYTEHHAEGVLEYRFAPKKGIPFPAFAEASAEFPELQVEAEWEHDGVRGRATLENGRLVQAPPEPPRGESMVEIAAGDDGRLELALACRPAGDALVGYAATAERHTYLRWRDGALTLIEPDQPDESLESLALAFAGEWLWYDEEEAPLERARYAAYGYAVRGANLRADKLAVLRANGMRVSTLDPAGAALRAALEAQWLKN